MKLNITLIVALFLSLRVGAQIEFFHGTWAEALEEAKKQGKPLFVDAYAKWCGPCKRMAATTFMDASVGEYFNKNFINFKIDAEEGEGPKFRQKYPVSAYPTLFFIDEKGEVIHNAVGGQDVKGLLRLGEMALSKVDYSKDYAVAYEKGERDYELVYNYVKSLNKSGKSSLKVANDYLRSDTISMTEEQRLRFILEAATEADSRIFGLLIENQKAIGMLEGLQAVRDRILYACENTAKKAAEYKSPELLAEAQNKMKQHYSEKADAFAAKSDLDYYKAMKDAKNYGKACEDYIKKVIDENPKDLNKLSEEIVNSFGGDEKCMKLAEKYAKQAAEKGGTYEFYYNYAAILLKNGKKKDALAAANKSLELVKGGETINSGAVRSVEMLIKQIEG